MRREPEQHARRDVEPRVQARQHGDQHDEIHDRRRERNADARERQRERRGAWRDLVPRHDGENARTRSRRRTAGCAAINDVVSVAIALRRLRRLGGDDGHDLGARQREHDARDSREHRRDAEWRKAAVRDEVAERRPGRRREAERVAARNDDERDDRGDLDRREPELELAVRARRQQVRRRQQHHQHQADLPDGQRQSTSAGSRRPQSLRCRRRRPRSTNRASRRRTRPTARARTRVIGERQRRAGSPPPSRPACASRGTSARRRSA